LNCFRELWPFWESLIVPTLITVAKSSCIEKCGSTDHKLLMGRRVVPIADISPVMSASIPAGSALAVSEVERVYQG
jgi:hypothetical protein